MPKFWERVGNEKKKFPKFGIGKGMKKSNPTFRERESGAIIPRNSREREWKEKSKLYDNIKEIFRKYLM